MRILAFGDIHMNLTGLASIPEIGTADLLIVSGDLTDFGGANEARSIIEQIMAVNSTLLALPGNLDRPDVGDYLTSVGVNLHGTNRNLNGVNFLGLGGSNPTPFNTPSEFSEDELSASLTAGQQQIKNNDPVVLVSHPPPLNTRTDVISGGHHVGSSAVRRFIEENQPMICVTGHIHESRAVDTIGKTQIVNPGMLCSGGWVEIIVKDNNITAELKP